MGIHRDIIICIGCSVGVGMKYIILAIIAFFIGFYIGMESHPVVLDGACIQGVVFVPKLISDGDGTSNLTYEECE